MLTARPILDRIHMPWGHYVARDRRPLPECRPLPARPDRLRHPGPGFISRFGTPCSSAGLDDIIKNPRGNSDPAPSTTNCSSERRENTPTPAPSSRTRRWKPKFTTPCRCTSGFKFDKGLSRALHFKQPLKSREVKFLEYLFSHPGCSGYKRPFSLPGR